MRTRHILLCFLLFALCFRAWWQYSIDWSTTDGGGGTSTGGVYTVSVTIGQPDAGQMSGGKFTLDGGYWGIVAAVPTPGAPTRSITLNAQRSTISVSWTSPSIGLTLQRNTNGVGSANWSNVTDPSHILSHFIVAKGVGLVYKGRRQLS